MYIKNKIKKDNTLNIIYKLNLKSYKKLVLYIIRFIIKDYYKIISCLLNSNTQFSDNLNFLVYSDKKLLTPPNNN